MEGSENTSSGPIGPVGIDGLVDEKNHDEEGIGLGSTKVNEANLPGAFQGKLLSTVGRDINNQIFPIAWVVVEVENRETWTWFLKNLQTDLNLGDGENVTLLSDMQKGLLEEVPLCLPNVEHKFCARHIYANWKKPQKRIGKLKKAAYDDLLVRHPRVWDLTGISWPHDVVVLPTIPSEKYWKDTEMPKIDLPFKRKMPRIPKHKRRREERKPSPTTNNFNRDYINTTSLYTNNLYTSSLCTNNHYNPCFNIPYFNTTSSTTINNNCSINEEDQVKCSFLDLTQGHMLQTRCKVQVVQHHHNLQHLLSHLQGKLPTLIHKQDCQSLPLPKPTI
ncbi:hypothetical protein F3Y22_tig00111344pilonHSYRG00032 [Hibiscus syriacus]|uniref:MULE transposase domain-containing protein n=1 Tax=Hibiscus syriacus TaxID=106335 RepID=A0A6A2YP09_HIBSY|nr:hypothetical protein F3Y22_tig00111344pilonHSYRG00032 [Hibiscus syriacus]